MAERTKFVAYLIYSLLVSAIIYPVFGSWAWGSLYKGGGWLEALGFIDFAGSTVVHSIGGWVALAGAIVLGPRIGKYTKEGKLNPIPGHNIPIAALGMFILWLGWFGFNIGSALTSGSLAATAFVTTNTSASASALAWIFTEWSHRGKPTVLGAATGAVAGLVAITPAAGFVGPLSSILIGIGAGILCYTAIAIIKPRFGYDDSLDVFGCHGIGGTWGAIATGLFASTAINPDGADGLFFGNPGQLVNQVIGVVTTVILSAIATFIILKAIDWTMGIRVTDEDEVIGLDLSQYGESGYSLS